MYLYSLKIKIKNTILGSFMGEKMKMYVLLWLTLVFRSEKIFILCPSRLFNKLYEVVD